MTDHYDVVIVGGGAAGIAAGRRLRGTGLSFLILEGGARLGGRAWTLSGEGLHLDMGCGWLHSAERNPWAKLAEELGFAIDKTPHAWQTQLADLGFSRAEQKAAGEAWQAFEKRLREEPPASDCAADALEPGNEWNDYLDAMSGYLNGASLSALSVRDYVTYSDAASDENMRVPAGYGALIAAAGEGLPVRLSTVATRIDRTGSPLRIETNAGTVMADAAIVTVSTHVLASGGVRFDPPLDGKAEAASEVPLGLANKAYLRLDEPGEFPPDAHLIGDPHSATTGSYYLRPLGMPAIECFFGGTGAEELEALGADGTADFALAQLAHLLGSSFRKRAHMIALSAWKEEALVGGSYSQALPGHADARSRLAEAVEERIFFAGEACSALDFSTAHGAYETGTAAAEAVLRRRGLLGEEEG